MNNTDKEYHIYENWVAHGHVSKIHKAECSFCNFGNGIHGTNNKIHGQWLGPYKTFNEAKLAALKTKAIVHTCKFCSPEADN